MTWEMRAEEREAVSRLDAPGRYGYFVKRVADWEEVWGLRDADGWATATDDDGRDFMPVWPHPDLARACSRSVRAGPNGDAVPVEPARLRQDLEDEAAAYE